MQRLVILAMAALHSFPVAAQPFVEFGLGIADRDSCLLIDMTPQPGRSTVRANCSRGALGIVAAGWRTGQWTLQIEHTSALQRGDPGLNVVSIRYLIQK